MKKEFAHNDEIMNFESISVANIQYEPDISTVFYGDEIANFVNSPVSQVDPDDYLCESSVFSRTIHTE
ncbi:MAG: hypothetical protein B5M53_03690 [Candidatus Cloacimonas sp. 4484_209]|nr:MAG: hypothetical protein B5M53_03690 [Candidatus Cloacimonas sp. 4484_209]